MSGQAPDAWGAAEACAGVYWCVVCGHALLGEPQEDGSFTYVHDDIDHPVGIMFNDEGVMH